MLTGAKCPKPHISLCGNRFNAFTPSKQILNGYGFAAWLRLDAGLVYRHTNLFDTAAINGLVPFQSTKGIQPHLRVVFGRYGHALTVLIVGNAQGITADHNAIAGAKALWYIFGKINLHLGGHIRLCVILHSPFGKVLQVQIRGLVHLVLVKWVFFQLF